MKIENEVKTLNFKVHLKTLFRKPLKVYYSTLAIALASLGIWIISDVLIGDEF